MKNPIVLHFDTSSAELLVLILQRGSKQIRLEKKGKYQSQTILSLLQTFLSDNGIALSEISGITVCNGPGTFTGIRVGIIIARMLGLLLNIPVNGNKAEKDIVPNYTPSKFDQTRQ